MIKSNVMMIIAGVVGTIGGETLGEQQIISTTIADYGVIAGMIIGGLGAVSKLAEVGTSIYWQKAHVLEQT